MRFRIQDLRFRKNKGFTLIEMVIVIGIFGMLAYAAIATLNPSEQFMKANDARRKSDLAQIQRALEGYYQDHQRYPSNPAATDYRIQGDVGVVDFGTSWQPYTNLLPKDSDPSKKYVYIDSADGQTYYLYASLDRGSRDSQACANGNDCPNVPAADLCGIAKKCNYGKTSPNVAP